MSIDNDNKVNKSETDPPMNLPLPNLNDNPSPDDLPLPNSSLFVSNDIVSNTNDKSKANDKSKKNGNKNGSPSRKFTPNDNVSNTNNNTSNSNDNKRMDTVELSSASLSEAPVVIPPFKTVKRDGVTYFDFSNDHILICVPSCETAPEAVNFPQSSQYWKYDSKSSVYLKMAYGGKESIYNGSGKEVNVNIGATVYYTGGGVAANKNKFPAYKLIHIGDQTLFGDYFVTIEKKPGDKLETKSCQLSSDEKIRM